MIGISQGAGIVFRGSTSAGGGAAPCHLGMEIMMKPRGVC